MAWYKCLGTGSGPSPTPVGVNDLQIRNSYYGNGFLPIFDDMFIDYTKSFEIAIRFRLSNSIGSSDILILGSEAHEYANPSIAIYSARTQIWYSVSTNNSSWDISDHLDLQTAMSFDVWYTIVYGIDANSLTQHCKLLDADGNIIAQKSTNISNLPWSSHSSNDDLLKFFSNKNLTWINANLIDIDADKTYIKNDGLIIWGVKGGGGGVIQPTKFWQGLQSQYDALISYESDRMYTIVATTSQMSDTMGGYINKISKIYIGDTLVYPVEEQGYDWCITDYFLPDSNASTNGDNRDYDMNVGVYFQSDANKNRDWQIEFKATLSTGSYSSGDQVLFGQGNNSSARLKEVYFNTSGDLYIAGNDISDTDYISGANGHDIKMIYSNANGTIELYKDGTLVNTITGVPTSYSAANYELGLCRYRSSYRFHGTINYFKFKWLS